jgi:hypothetical protein
VNEGWPPQHKPNTTQHPDAAARDTNTGLQDKVTASTYIGDPGEVIPEDLVIPRTGDPGEVIPEDVAAVPDKILTPKVPEDIVIPRTEDQGELIPEDVAVATDKSPTPTGVAVATGKLPQQKTPATAAAVHCKPSVHADLCVSATKCKPSAQADCRKNM